MKSFTYQITDEVGLHARPAGKLAKEAKQFQSKITLSLNGDAAELTRLISVMALGVKKDDVVTVTIEGPDEQEAAQHLEKFFNETI